VSQSSLQNSPLESSCVVVAFMENYSTSKLLKFSPEKSHVLSCDSVVANQRYVYARLNLYVIDANYNFKGLKASRVI
jgi:hypothetical protein